MKRIAYLASPALAVLIFTSVSAMSAIAAAPEIHLPAETVKLRSSPLPGFAIATEKCAICHSADYIAYQPPGMNQTQWTAEMAKMQHTYGAPISDSEVKQLGAYLAVAYGSAKASDPAVIAASNAVPSARLSAGKPVAQASDATVDVQALLSSNACLSCHGLTQKIVGPAYHDVALKYHAEPQAQATLEASIRAGSTGKWGRAAMPPFAALKPEELKALAAFVLKQ
jgi:cytochrome c551/c552